MALSLCFVVSGAVAAEPPWNLKPLGRIGGWCWAVQVVGPYAYLVEGGNLTILYISNPSLPLPVGHFSPADFRFTDVEVSDGLAYVVGRALVGSHGLQILDVSAPRSPRIRSFYPTPVTAQGVYVTGGLAYVACGEEDHAVRGGKQPERTKKSRGRGLHYDTFSWHRFAVFQE